MKPVTMPYDVVRDPRSAGSDQHERTATSPAGSSSTRRQLDSTIYYVAGQPGYCAACSVE